MRRHCRTLFPSQENLFSCDVYLFVWRFSFVGRQQFGDDFGTVRGIVHDPQHRPMANVEVTLKAKSSNFRRPCEPMQKVNSF